MFGGSGSGAGTKLSFTLPISCQICLEKVKDPVTCPQQHVFCSTCLDIWLERSKHCPTCRADITPQTPVRKIIGGLPQSQDDEKRSPRTSKQLRRTRMELVMKDYENEIDDLQTEIIGLKHTNDDLKQRLKEGEKRGGSSSGGKTCTRCGNMQDIDSMLEMAKNLQEATKTFGEMKKENEELKLRNEKLAKDNDDLKRRNVLAREEVLMRSPMKFGRLTVAALEKRVEAYEKQVTQLQKALERNDSHTEQLRERLENCSCSKPGVDVADSACVESDRAQCGTLAPVDASCGGNAQTFPVPDMPSSQSHHHLQITGQNRVALASAGSFAGESYAFENALPEGLLVQDVRATAGDAAQDVVRPPNLAAAARSLGSSFVELACSSDVQSRPGVEVANSPEVPQRDAGAKAKCFTAQMMPPPESPDYGNKLRQIQNNLLHPITTAADSTTGQVKTFSRRLCFEQSAPSESKQYSSDSAFVRLQSPLECTDVVSSFCGLADSSSNPLLTSPCRSGLAAKQVSSPVLDVGKARITAGKLVQSCHDVSTRPSSAPSRTFLLSGSRFSAITPIDPQLDDDGTEPQFQPVKTRSPSSLSLMSPLLSKRKVSVASRSDGVRLMVDGRTSSDPLLKLVSPDDVISSDWRDGPEAVEKPESPSGVCTPGGSKSTISRVGILKRNLSTGKIGPSDAFAPRHCQVEEGTLTPSRKNARKQCLRDNKRLGDNSLEFLSPLKARKVQGTWNCE